jgi:hypothetical protein
MEVSRKDWCGRRPSFASDQSRVTKVRELQEGSCSYTCRGRRKLKHRDFEVAFYSKQ